MKFLLIYDVAKLNALLYLFLNLNGAQFLVLALILVFLDLLITSSGYLVAYLLHY